MECQSSDSKKLFKVFDASKRKRTKKKRDGLDDSNSVVTDESGGNGRRVTSAKASLQDVQGTEKNIPQDVKPAKSSPFVSATPDDRRARSPRRHRRAAREGISLALKAGLVSTPRSLSPTQDGDVIDSIPKDQDSFIYAFLEEAIKRDKKKHRHAKKYERRESRDRDASITRDHRHHHRYRDDPYRGKEKVKDEPRPPPVDHTVLETFAKLCEQIAEKKSREKQMPRTQSHKSLQCEVVSRRDSYNAGNRPVRLPSREQSRDVSPSCTRSYDNFQTRIRSRDNIATSRRDKCACCPVYDKEMPRYSSKMEVERIKPYEDDKYRDYGPECIPARSTLDEFYKSRAPVRRDYKDYDDRDLRSRYYDDRRRYCEQKASRSFEIRKNVNDDEKYRRTTRSDGVKEKDYDDRSYRNRRLDDRIHRDRYYDEKEARERSFAQVSGKDRRLRRNGEGFDRSSIASREEDYKDRERYSERERDSGLSVADGETSTISGRSNYLRVVKQEISEQREAMDKMMKLWKELMRCFKGVSQTPCRDKDVHESAENMRESAAAQLRLWRECMRRYETVARDVGDTDARLMEEITKQRSEMAEMASMWQECLQRYRDMSNDFNSLKQKLATSESPTRPAPPLVCAEGEGPPAAPYRLPPAGYPPVPPAPPYAPGGSPLRARASAPPAWWWSGEWARPPRRRSSPDSAGSRERRPRKERERERDSSRYKEKSSKPSGARSEHRHRKR
ncbi:uncharacterized protein LOC123700955 [Colias croceus]|uniref:uncharacterized protein LOC123700955 n=1 Tax=Colias crocea TaxID=72248 RepID=UPI001E2806EA|nr:uncharacterized protein LOC123700955 [Colias croceus]